MKKRKVRPIIWRLFHRKKRRASSKAFQRLLDVHLKMHREMEGLIVDGQFYEAAVEKFQENKLEEKMEADGVLLAEGSKQIAYEVIPVIRISKLPELLLLLGVRIRG